MTYAEMVPIQETEQDAYKGSELVSSRGVFNNSYYVSSCILHNFSKLM